MPFSTTEKPQIIRKSNELIEARYKLNIAEQRLVLLLASEITPDDEDFKSYEIRVTDFAKMFGLEKCKAMYAEIEKAAEGLLSQKIILQDNKTKEITTWLSYVKYVKGSGVVHLEFHKSLKPYLLQLKGHYTQYQLNHVMNFKSQYSMRLYELLKMNAFKIKNGQFEKTIEIGELRLMLGIDKKDYPLFANFKQKTIQPAISEISDKTDLFINDVHYGKTGRKITNITFVVGVRSEEDTKLRQANLRIEDIQPEKESENHAIVNKMVSLGFSLEMAKKFKNKYPIGLIERNISYTLAKKVDNIPAYLNMAIENDYAGGDLESEYKKKEQAKKQKDQLEAEQKAKEKQERETKKADKEKTEKILADFELLPENEKIEIIESYIITVPEIIKTTIVELYKKHGVNVCKKSVQFTGLFVPFLRNTLSNVS